MNKTGWSDKRLRRLFDRYNQLYFRGKLSDYRVAIGTLADSTRGTCNWSKRKITIDTEHHANDRYLRGTVLHEMAHAACAGRSQGHDVHFFRQLERLLQSGAPVTVDIGEAGKVAILANLVPTRFPLLKRKMDRVEACRRKKFEDFAKTDSRPAHQVTNEEILFDFEKAVYDGLAWKQALIAVSPEYGLTDECGRPLTAWSRRLLAKARNVHRRARREQRDSEKAKREILKMKAAE